MARPVKKTPEQWKEEILSAAKKLFLSKGYEETSVSDIMEAAGGAKGMFYRFFPTKEAAMHTLGDRMFLENNPFEAADLYESERGEHPQRSGFLQSGTGEYHYYI